MKFIKTINPKTNKEQLQAQFSGKLLSISDREFENTNGKNYKVATIEFADINGEIQRASCFIYEGNYKYGMEVGQSYLATATKTDQGPIIQLSHLQSAADRPTADMFGEFSEAEVSVPANTPAMTA